MNTNGPPGFTLAFSIGTASQKALNLSTSTGATGGNVASRTGPNDGNFITNNAKTAAPGAGTIVAT